MQQLSPEYLAELGRQIAFLSAFLGGFAATFLATLLTSTSGGRQVTWTAASAGVAAAAFIVAVIAGTAMAVVLSPGAPAIGAEPSRINHARVAAALGFAVGIYAMLLALGLSGWIRSRKLGIATSSAAFIAGVIVTWAVAGF